MTRRTAQRLIAAAGVFAPAAIVTAMLGVAAHWWPTVAGAAIASVFVVACVGMATLATAVGLNRPAPAAVPVGEQIPHAVQLLADLVNERWSEEARYRGLDEIIPVRWLPVRRGLVDHRHKIHGASQPLAGTSQEIEELARSFLALQNRRLVILGDAGSGKTSLTVQMLLELIRARSETDPVPVYITVSEWNTTQFPRLRDWLAFRVRNDYAQILEISRGIVDDLISRNNVMPIIDGLDELEPGHRLAVFRTINDTLDHQAAIIVSCRTSEYVSLVNRGRVIRRSVGVESQPLTVAQMISYIRNCLPPDPVIDWNPVFDRFRAEQFLPLAQMCSTPLGLWLIRAVYLDQDRDPAHLLDPVEFPTEHDMKKHLYSELVSALAATGDRRRREHAQTFTPKRSWKAEDVSRWLGFLAGRLGANRDFAWWRLPNALPASAVRKSAANIVRNYIGGTAAIGCCLCAFGASLHKEGILFALIQSLAIGIIVYIYFGCYSYLALTRGRDKNLTSRPAKVDLRLKGRGSLLREKTIEVIPGVLEFAGLMTIIMGLAVWFYADFDLSREVKVASTLFLTIFLSFASALGIINSIVYSETDPIALTPQSEFKQARLSAIVEVVLLGTAILICVVATGTVCKAAWSWVAPIAFSIVGSFAIVSCDPAHSPWIAFLATKRLLAKNQQLPQNLMQFLDDCHLLGLLRAAGPLYEFRHAELQDYLADSSADRESTGSLSAPETAGWHVVRKRRRSGKVSRGETMLEELLRQNTLEDIAETHRVVGPGIYLGVITRMVTLSRDRD